MNIDDVPAQWRSGREVVDTLTFVDLGDVVISCVLFSDATTVFALDHPGGTRYVCAGRSTDELPEYWVGEDGGPDVDRVWGLWLASLRDVGTFAGFVDQWLTGFVAFLGEQREGRT